MPPSPPVQRLFDIDFCALTLDDATRLLATLARAPGPGAKVVVTPNVDHLVRLDDQPEFRARYVQADLFFADGMPLVWASRWLGRPLPERVTGSDLFVRLCQQAASHAMPVVIVGGTPGQEAELEAAFARHYPGLPLTVIAPAMGFDPQGDEARHIAARVRELRPDLIFVCLGMPRQEHWALNFAPTFDHGVALCVGAAMEFAIGLRQRAPKWVQRIGAEWLWRLLSDPRRLWRRYLVEDRKFVGILWREWRAHGPARR